MSRQLDHQAKKAERLRGLEEEIVSGLALRWRRMESRLRRFRPEWGDPRLLEVGSGAHGLLFGSDGARAVGVDPLAAPYARCSRPGNGRCRRWRR